MIWYLVFSFFYVPAFSMECAAPEKKRCVEIEYIETYIPAEKPITITRKGLPEYPKKIPGFGPNPKEIQHCIGWATSPYYFKKATNISYLTSLEGKCYEKIEKFFATIQEIGCKGSVYRVLNFHDEKFCRFTLEARLKEVKAKILILKQGSTRKQVHELFSPCCPDITPLRDGGALSFDAYPLVVRATFDASGASGLYQHEILYEIVVGDLSAKVVYKKNYHQSHRQIAK